LHGARWETRAPIVVLGQLHCTLRDIRVDTTLIDHAWAEVEDPSGDRATTAAGSGACGRTGVCAVHYPLDFEGAPRLRPGRYVVRWYGPSPSVSSDRRSSSALLAEDSWHVDEDWAVEPG
jgi:hypothetical protein